MPIYFPTRDRKGVDLDVSRGGDDLEVVGGWETVIRIYCTKKSIFTRHGGACHAFAPSTWETKTGRFLSLRLTCSTE